MLQMRKHADIPSQRTFERGVAGQDKHLAVQHPVHLCAGSAGRAALACGQMAGLPYWQKCSTGQLSCTWIQKQVCKRGMLHADFTEAAPRVARAHPACHRDLT